MGLLKIYNIDEKQAEIAIERWWTNPYYQSLCNESGVKSPEQLQTIIDSGDLARVPVILDTDAKILPERNATSTVSGGKSIQLTRGLIDSIPSTMPLFMDFSSGANPDCVIRTEEEIVAEKSNYLESFIKGTGKNHFDGLLSLFPSRSSLVRGAKDDYKKAAKAGIVASLDRPVNPRRQTESGLDAAESISDMLHDGLLKFSLPLTILNKTVLRRWQGGAVHILPNHDLITGILREYEKNGKTALIGTSPIFAYLYMNAVGDCNFDFKGRICLHGGGGGYRGWKGPLKLPNEIDQTQYANMMKRMFGVYPSETYGYTGQTHTLVLRWNPDREWFDGDKQIEKKGAYEAYPKGDVCGSAIIYAFNPLRGEVCKSGPGLLRSINFEGSHAQFDGAMQVQDRCYVDGTDKYGVPIALYGIRGIGDKPGC